MIDRLERLLNLVIALRETRRPMTAAEIRERVAGYGQPDLAAFRRMFERDKADLRALGVPIAAGPVDRWDDRIGYRIEAQAYDLPPVRLRPAELAALAVALQATGLAGDAGAGLRKLEVDAALDPAPDPGSGGAPAVSGATPPPLGVDLDAPHRRELMEAQLTRTPVRFAYRRLGQDPQERIVEPHALVHRGGFWYVVGHDRGRGARRAFRLDRIVAAVHPAGDPGSFAAPTEEVRVDEVVPPAPGEPQYAEVVAAPEVAWQIARRAQGGGRPAPTGEGTVFSVVVGDPDTFLAWALEFGPDLQVVAPAALRERLITRAREARRHARAALAAGGGSG